MGFNEDKAEGKFDQAKGSAKEGLGNLTGNNDLKAEGKADKTSGKAQEGLGNLKDKADQAGKNISAAADKLKEKFNN